MIYLAVVAPVLFVQSAAGYPGSPSEVARLVGNRFVANGSIFLNWEAGFTCECLFPGSLLQINTWPTHCRRQPVDVSLSSATTWPRHWVRLLM